LDTETEEATVIDFPDPARAARQAAAARG
jgi:hypothetical protein